MSAVPVATSIAQEDRARVSSMKQASHLSKRDGSLGVTNAVVMYTAQRSGRSWSTCNLLCVDLLSLWIWGLTDR